MALTDKLKSIKNLGTAVTPSTKVVENTPYNRFMDNVARLPRLFLLFGVVAILVWPVFNPEYFMVWTKAVSTIPADLWYLIFIIMTSWVGTKFMRDIKQPSASATTITQVNTGTVVQTGEISEKRFNNLNDDNPEIKEDAEEIMNSDPENEVIEEWKGKNAA